MLWLHIGPQLMDGLSEGKGKRYTYLGANFR